MIIGLAHHYSIGEGGDGIAMPMSISAQRSNFRVTRWESVVILVVIGAGETWPGV